MPRIPHLRKRLKEAAPEVMLGNDDTGETILIERAPGRYTAIQVKGANDTHGQGILCNVTSNVAFRQWWEHYAETFGPFYKLQKLTFKGEPIVLEMSDTEQSAPLPYTDTSLVGVPTVPHGSPVPQVPHAD